MVINRKTYTIIILSLISIIIVLFTPYGYHIDLGPGPNSIVAMIWEYSSYYSFRYIVPLRYYVQFYFFRIIVLFFIVRFFQGKISRKWLIVVSIIDELIPLLLSIPGALILNAEGENLMAIIISIPILLLYTLILTFFFKIHNQKLIK